MLAMKLTFVSAFGFAWAMHNVLDLALCSIRYVGWRSVATLIVTNTFILMASYTLRIV